MLFIPLAVAFALFNRKHDHLLLNTIVGVALLIVCIAVGIYCPIYFSKNLWLVVVFAYIFIASVAPVWILLQSRDYLNSFLGQFTRNYTQTTKRGLLTTKQAEYQAPGK